MRAVLLLVLTFVQAAPSSKPPASVPVITATPITEPAKPKQPTKLELAKSYLDIVQSIATIVGIAAGAIWFFKKRERFPSATLGHTITRAPLGNGQQFIRVTVNICNKGGVLLRIVEARSAIMQITPPPESLLAELSKPHPHDPVKKNATDYAWTWLRDRNVTYDVPLEVEPNEEQQIDWDFFVPEDLQVIASYTYIKNQNKKKEIGWELTTTHDLSAQPDAAVAGVEKAKSVRSKGAGK